MASSNKNNTIPAVERAMALLDYLSAQEGGATQAQLQKALGLSMSSTYRILQTLGVAKTKMGDTSWAADCCPYSIGFTVAEVCSTTSSL